MSYVDKNILARSSSLHVATIQYLVLVVITLVDEMELYDIAHLYSHMVYLLGYYPRSKAVQLIYTTQAQGVQLYY